MIGVRGHMQLLVFLMKKEKRSRLLAAFFVWDDISSCSEIKKSKNSSSLKLFSTLSCLTCETTYKVSFIKNAAIIKIYSRNGGGQTEQGEYSTN